MVVRNTLEAVTIKGFKTIKVLEDFKPKRLTVLIGANGAGKSNFISFFRMLSWALVSEKNLALYVAQQGGASALLHDGPEVTQEIKAELVMATESGRNEYVFWLYSAARDTLFFADERYCFVRHGSTLEYWQEAGAGHTSPQLVARSHSDRTASVIRTILSSIKVYQFHNTSYTARMRNKWDVNDSGWLREDAGNIAPLLLRLRQREPVYYQRIVETLRLVLPFFQDFVLEPDYGNVMLCWRECNCDRMFNAAQASDGMLRTIALVTLLLQPPQNLPNVLILDEPELGLHPYAINVVGELICAAAQTVQVIVATQSTLLIDCFEPQDVVVVERDGRASLFKRLEAEPLSEWLQEYSTSELWEKNVVGGTP